MKNSSSDLLTLVLLVVAALGVILVLWGVIACLRKFFDWRVFKNRERFFEINKALCSKRKADAEKVMNLYSSYMKYISDFGLNKEIRCSYSVVSSASQNPTGYILKYSNIDRNIKDLERLEYIERFIVKHSLFTNKMDQAGEHIRQRMPLLYRIFANRKTIPYVVCGCSYKLATIKNPFLRFLYISPGGKSRKEANLVLSVGTIDGLVSEISKSISKKGHSKLQRSIMTNDLREAIKKRDNYTCCKCGNSVYKEPNLLLEVDHIIPISKGGKTEASNLQTLCWRCNREKSDK